jgi:uncharacterized protein (DUF3820 family)
LVPKKKPSWILPFGKYSPKVIVDHTLNCFVKDEEFNFVTLNETYQKSQEIKKQRNAIKSKSKNIDRTLNSAEVDIDSKPVTVSVAQ